jgi:hypothetical protein
VSSVDRDWHIRMARTYLAPAMVVRQRGIHHGWHATLMSWVAKRRVQAATIKPEPVQSELF